MQVPDSLKFIKPYVRWANETESARPLIAYFCRLQAISKIIEQQAQNRDDEAGNFAEHLMTQLEAFRKDQNLAAEDREIMEDEEKSKTHVKEFGRAVLAGGQRQIANHTVNQRTALSLLSAATFLEVLDLWPENDQGDSIKFAKYHASRIMKALSAGQDPNDLFKNEQEVAQEDAELEKELNALVQNPQSAEPPQEEEAQGEGTVHNNDNDEDDHADHADKQEEINQQSPSASPSSTHASPSPVLPAAPNSEPVGGESEDTLPQVPGELPGVHLPVTPNKQPNNLGLPEAPESRPSVVFDYEPAPRAPSIEEFKKAEKAAPVPQVPAKPAPKAATDVNAILNEAETTQSAQKHAKYAISALNYDDYSTAISELQQALDVLQVYQQTQSN